MAPSMRYDLFISYAESDRAWVVGYLIDALERAGLRYHSEEAFTLGRPRLLEFEHAVQSSQRTLLILSPAYLSNQFSQFVELLSQTYGLETATWPVIPLVLHPIKLPLHLAVLQSLDATDPTTWPVVIERLCAAFQRPLPTPAPPPPCPYPGMMPFREADSDRFFGREREIQDIIERLRLHPILAVIGPSGSGKSSLVLAGVLPALRKSGLFGAGEWIVRAIRPGDRPLATLADAISDFPKAREVGLIEGGLAAPMLDLELPQRTRLLLVVDQFEEIFTLGGEEGLPFQRALLRLSQAAGCYVILTMRADFYPDLMAAPTWRSVQAHRFEVAPLTEEGLRAAIKRPAEDVGVLIETALVERLVTDGASEPGMLPLIQETLVLLWEHLERRFLPLRAYDAVILTQGTNGATGAGGQTGMQIAMARRADATLAELSPEQQAIARRIFLRLIQFGEGRADTRRQQSVAALGSAAGAEPLLFEATLQHLTNARLLTMSGEVTNTSARQAKDERVFPNRRVASPSAIHSSSAVVDIAHEALIAGWPTLYGWLNEQREAEQIRRRLEAKVAEWVRLGCGDGGLLDIVELVEAERWLESTAADDAGFDSALPELVVFSRAAIEQVEYEKEQARQRELAQAQALAEHQSRASNRFRKLAMVLTAVLFLAIGAAALAVVQQQAAARSEARAIDNESKALTANAAQIIAFSNQNTAFALVNTAKADAEQKANIAATSAAEARTAQLAANRNAGEAQRNAETAEAAKREAQANAQTAQANANAEATARTQSDINFEQSQANAQEAKNNAATAQANAATATVAQGQAEANFQLAEANAATSQANADLASSRLGQAQRAQAQSDANAATAQSNADAAHAAQAQAVHNAQAEATAKQNALQQAAAAQTAQAQAQQQAAIARSRQLAALSLYYQDKQLDLALLLGVESNRASETLESRSNLLHMLELNSHLATILASSHITSTLTSIAFSPDRKMLVVGGTDGSVQLWDVSLRRALGALPTSNASGVVSVAFSPSGKILAVGYNRGSVELWDVAGRQSVGALLSMGDDSVTSVAFSPDGKILAVGGGRFSYPGIETEGWIGLWDVATQQRIGLPATTAGVRINSIAFSPDGKILAAGGVSFVFALGTLQLWDVATQQPTSSSLNNDGADINSVAFSPDGATLAAGQGDGNVRLWYVAKPRVTPFKLSAHTGDVRAVAFSPDGKALASAGDDGTVRLWDVAAYKEIGAPLTRGGDTVRSVAFSPDGKALASAGDDGTVRLCDIANGQPLVTSLPGHTSAVNSVAFSSDAKMLASGGDDGAVRLWDAATHQTLGAPITISGIGVTSVAFSPDGKMLVSGGDDGAVRLWDVATRQPIGAPLTGHTGAVNSVAFSRDGKMLVSGGDDGAVRLWDVATRQPVGALHTNDGVRVTSVAFNPSGKTLASGEALPRAAPYPFNPTPYAIRLWDVATRQPIGAPLTGHTNDVTSVAFSLDEKTLASGGNDGTLRLWDVATRQPIGALSANNTYAITSVAFSPDQKTLASGESDGTLGLWDVATRQPIGAPLRSDGDWWNGVNSVAFSSDGNTLASAWDDGLLKLWDLDIRSWQARACSIANRNLTASEWTQFFGSDPYRKTCTNLP